MIQGYVVNNSGRHKHIFKHRFAPGHRVALEDIYVIYQRQYKGDFDEEFVEWFKHHKLPKDGSFDVVIEKIFRNQSRDRSDREKMFDSIAAKHPSKLTAKEISSLRIRDKPREKLRHVTSIHKLRRALTYCYNGKGKEMLIAMIKDRIKELQNASG